MNTTREGRNEYSPNRMNKSQLIKGMDVLQREIPGGPHKAYRSAAGRSFSNKVKEKGPDTTADRFLCISLNLDSFGVAMMVPSIMAWPASKAPPPTPSIRRIVWARDNLTVEDVLFGALMRTRLIASVNGCHFSRCGRTDAGVSADMGKSWDCVFGEGGGLRGMQASIRPMRSC